MVGGHTAALAAPAQQPATTANHPWLTADHGWVPAGLLRPGEPATGDRLISSVMAGEPLAAAPGDRSTACQMLVCSPWVALAQVDVGVRR